MGFAVGQRVRMEMSKWRDQPHWAFDAVWLGSDEHGDWVGFPRGTPMSRPGFSLVSKNDQVGLVPGGDAPVDERWWVATFHGEPREWVATYVDITTPPVWDGHVLRTVDLDLDIIRRVDGSVFVDDEDEFAEHQVALAYPDEINKGAVASCEMVERLVTRGEAPYDGSHQAWLAALGAHLDAHPDARPDA